MHANKDVILSLQAGFIGTWGEWYYTSSSEFGTNGTVSSTQWNNRKEIVDAMLASAPVDVPIQVRYVAVKEMLYGASQLTEHTAYEETPNARIGFYNDALLNNYGDMGTYPTNACENPVGTSAYAYLSNETKYLPMTGETNGLNPFGSGFRTTGSNAIYEMELTNWSVINRDYHQDFWNQLNSNDYATILKNLGYRFVLNSSTVNSNTLDFDLALTFTNVGFARPLKQRDVFLVMKNTATNEVTTHLINTDIRTWESSVSLTQNSDPGVTGTFQLYLWMPDEDQTLSTNSDYSIRFANTGLWDPATGFNDLQQTITLDVLGVADSSGKNPFYVYPNPSSDFIKIPSNGYEEEEVQFYNSIGQVVKETTFSKNEKIDVSDLKTGIYFIRLRNNPSKTLKFVKQ